MRMIAPLLAVLLPGAAAFGLPYSDGEFLDTDWTHVLIVDTRGGSTTVSAQHVDTGGNPGAYQAGSHTFGNTILYYAHLLDGAVYDPASQGALGCLSMRLDFRVTSGSGSCGPSPSNPQVTVNHLILQGGQAYLPLVGQSPAQSQGWVTVEHLALLPASFGALTQSGTIDASSHPDFSTAGAPIEFGYVTANSTGSSSCARSWCTDNYEVFGCPVSVEGASWAFIKSRYSQR